MVDYGEWPHGHEQGFQRPSIIAKIAVGMCIVIPLTTTAADLERFPHTLGISRTSKTCLDAKSVALVFQIRAIDPGRILGKVGELEQEHIAAIKSTIKDMFGL